MIPHLSIQAARWGAGEAAWVSVSFTGDRPSGSKTGGGMKKDYRFLSVGVVVFKVLAWVSLVLQVVVGLILLVGGGPAVPIGGITVPARVVGVLNCVAGGIYFFTLLLIANVICLLLDIREHVGKSGTLSS